MKKKKKKKGKGTAEDKATNKNGSSLKIDSI